MADLDGASIQSDRRDLFATGRAIQSDDGFDELRPVSGKPAGNRNVPHMGCDAGDQLAAVDRETVRQDEHAGEIVGRQRPADRFTVQPGVGGILYRFDRGPDLGRIEADPDGVDSAFDDFVAADLAVRRAPHQAGVGKHLAQFPVPPAVGERFAAAEVRTRLGTSWTFC